MEFMSHWRSYLVVGVSAFVLGGLVVFYIWQFVGGGAWRGGVDIMEAGWIDSNTLELRVASCNGNPSLSIRHQEDGSVRLRVVAFSTPLKGGDDCQDSIEIYLSEPFKDRLVIDDHTNRVVTFQ